MNNLTISEDANFACKLLEGENESTERYLGAEGRNVLTGN